MSGETPSLDCEFQIQTREIEKRTMKGAKKYLQIRYVQTKGDEVPKTELERVEELTRRAKEAEAVKRAAKNKTTIDGVKFLSTGEADGKGSKLLINKEDTLRKKFEQMLQEKTAEKVDPNARTYGTGIRVRIPDIMFFDPDPTDPQEVIQAAMDSEKEKFTVLLESIMRQVKNRIGISDIRTNYRNCVRVSDRDKGKRLRDFAILYFDKLEWAEEFVKALEGVSFNKFNLQPHIMENKP
jgi:hypothetical protein